MIAAAGSNDLSAALEFLAGVPGQLASTPTLEFSPFVRETGQSCKTIFDCTVPVVMREVFEQALPADIDLGDHEGLEGLG